MKSILKYKIPGPDSTFDGPAGMRPLTCQPNASDNQPVIWFLADSQALHVKHQVLIYATGQILPDNPGNYVGTLQMRESGKIGVLHVFHREVPLAISAVQ